MNLLMYDKVVALAKRIKIPITITNDTDFVYLSIVWSIESTLKLKLSTYSAYAYLSGIHNFECNFVSVGGV